MNILFNPLKTTFIDCPKLFRKEVYFVLSFGTSSAVTTVHNKPWPLLRLITIGRFSVSWAAIAKSFSTFKAFYGVGLSTPSQTPNLEDQDVLF
jgi:hypothetical protein